MSKLFYIPSSQKNAMRNCFCIALDCLKPDFAIKTVGAINDRPPKIFDFRIF